MFERYTEKARRVIFFARWEASQLGSPYIETEYLLLGLIRESKDLLHLFHDRVYPADDIRTRIEQAQPVRAQISTSVDLPLSNQSKRVLAYAAEEAERLHHKHIGTEHLFLGLLREPTTAAAKILIGRGLTLNEARERIARREASSGAAPLPASSGITELHGAGWANDYLNSVITDLKKFAWQKQTWKTRDILVEKQTGRIMFYAAGDFDTARFEAAPGGWKRDHCAICKWPLYESDAPEHGIAYTNGRDWVCTECHDKFFAPPITPLEDLYT